MSKYSKPFSGPEREQREPKHSKGWNLWTAKGDSAEKYAPSTPGKHAKPFGKHHPATPVIYDRHGNVTPMAPVEHALDVAA